MCNSERWHPSLRSLRVLTWILSMGGVAIVVQAVRFIATRGH